MMEAVEFLILFRRPEYPVLIVSSGKINSAFNLKELAKICVTIAPDGNNKSQIIDSKGSEF
jgi:hypothetical protein